MAISTARERQPAYERAADPQRATGRIECQRGECVERRRLARAQAQELRDLKVIGVGAVAGRAGRWQLLS